MPLFKLGRNRPVALGPRLSLKNYLTTALPAPPAALSYQRRARESLHKMYLNDSLGDCVIAAIAHTVGVLTANAGDQFWYSDEQIVRLYSAIGGYVPGDPSTDNGCDELTALNYWLQNGAPAGSHAIAGYVAIDPANAQEIQTALWLFENLFFGLNLPNAWIDPFPSENGFVWDAAGAPNPNNGHCISCCGYYDGQVVISTWGMTGLITDAAVAKYGAIEAGGGLYAVLSDDAIAAAALKAPNGFDWQQLQADFKAIGGSGSS